MRRISTYIHERKQWPDFQWNIDLLILPLTNVRYRQGRLIGKLEGLGFNLREEASLETLTLDVIKTSEIEGEKLPPDQVRSSIARRLGIRLAKKVNTTRDVDGVVDMMLNATQAYDKPLTAERLFGWHAALFPAGKSGLQKIKTGAWRTGARGPMQVVSGVVGKEHVHFEAPNASLVKAEMSAFLKWFNKKSDIDPVIKAAIAHLWFVTIHPFEDGNGRIARAISDLQLARADESRQRFYSMSAQIQRERNAYYDILEKTQKGDLDITQWLLWFLACLDRSIGLSAQGLSNIVLKAGFWETHREIALNERQTKILNKLLDGFDGNMTSTKWAKITKCSPDTALRDIQDLINKNILEKDDGGGRSTSYRIKI